MGIKSMFTKAPKADLAAATEAAPWTIDNFDPPTGHTGDRLHGAAVVFRQKWKVGSPGYLAESGIPGGHKYVAPQGTENDRAREAMQAQEQVNARFGRLKFGVLVVPTRRVLGRDVLRGLLACGGELVNICGTPRVVRFQKPTRDLLFVHDDLDVIPDEVIAALARDAGVKLADLEKHAGITAARELATRNAAAIAEGERKILADQERVRAHHAAEAARADADHHAAEAKAARERAEVVARRAAELAAMGGDAA